MANVFIEDTILVQGAPMVLYYEYLLITVGIRNPEADSNWHVANESNISCQVKGRAPSGGHWEVLQDPGWSFGLTGCQLTQRPNPESPSHI